MCYFHNCRYTLETNLKIEREWRSGIQTDLEQEKERVESLEKELLQLKILQEVPKTDLRIHNKIQR